MRKLKTVLLGMICLSLTSVAAAERSWPDHKFECQVVTASGARGLVAMQTHSRQRAESVVLGRDAITDRDTVEKAASVVQCIEPAKGEQFADLGFRGWLNTLEE